jgi:hypothetical protein
MIKTFRSLAIGASIIIVALFISCSRTQERARADVTLSDLEKTYGRMIGVGNAPTAGQHGTGDRLGLFQDDSGTIWGIPLVIGQDNSIRGCAPPELRELPVTDTLPSDISEILGATNEPSGWRGGTGRLELVFRDSQGVVHWHAVSSAELKTQAGCMTDSPPSTPSKFYRLAKAPSK